MITNMAKIREKLTLDLKNKVRLSEKQKAFLAVHVDCSDRKEFLLYYLRTAEKPTCVY